MGLLEEESDYVRRHACLGGFLGDQARAVEYRDDDDQRKGIGSGKLGEFGALGDTAKTACSCDDHGSL
jgi:hypothetical protein